jgi:hypothetical protein
MQLVDRVMALGAAVRYAALAHGAETVTRLRPDLKAGDGTTSSSESDRYEELLVNPAVLLLTRRRGEIDCGGLDHVVISYGNFHQLVIPLDEGHLSVALERTADPQSFVAPIRRILDQESVANTPRRRRSA